MNLEQIFTYHRPTELQARRYELLRPAFRQYAEALISERVLSEDGELVIELAYEDIVRTLNDLVPTDSPEYEESMKFIDKAYDIARDPNHAIVLAVQVASMFANAAIAINE